jgi:peptidoglycan/xylan/chitin deacetylase (PgdA/CDA1 family)
MFRRWKRALACAVIAAGPAAAPMFARAAGLVPHEAEARPVTVSRVSTVLPVVALTFDACPTLDRRGFDREVFEILRREKVPATVFVSGRWVEKHWAEARELAAEPLIELGNHSYRHPAFSRMSVEQVREEIDVTDRLIASLGRRSVAVRPPFGDWAGWLPEATGGQPVVLWDVVSGDAGGHIAPDAIVNTVSARARPGSIVVFHINGRGTYTHLALPRIIRRLRARGMRFVRVSELLHLEGAEVVQARPQRYTRKLRPPVPQDPRDELQDDLYDHPPGETDQHADPKGEPDGSTPPG